MDKHAFLYSKLEIDRYISLADIIGRYLGFADILVSAKTPDLSASVSVVKTLLYFSRIQITCSRKHNKASQDSYLAATQAGAFS